MSQTAAEASAQGGGEQGGQQSEPLRRSGRNPRAVDKDKMPTGYVHRTQEWWENFDRNDDRPPAEREEEKKRTKPERDAALKVFEAERQRNSSSLQSKRTAEEEGEQDGRNRSVGGRKKARATAAVAPGVNGVEAMDVSGGGGSGGSGGGIGGIGGGSGGGSGGIGGGSGGIGGGSGGIGGGSGGGSGGIGGGSGGIGGSGGGNGGGSDYGTTTNDDGSDDDSDDGSWCCSDDGSDDDSDDDGGPANALTSTEAIRRLATPWDGTSEKWVSSSRELGDQRAEKRKGSAPRGSNEPSGNASIPVMANLLGGGLCTDPKRDDIEIGNGVFFAKKKLEKLRVYYERTYVFNPKDIGVAIGKTRVKIDGKVLVVVSFDHGKYALENREDTFTQWEVLKNRCDGGVSFDTDIRRFIIHLVKKYVVMKVSVVPFVGGSKNETRGMLWNVDGALASARASADGKDPQSGWSTRKLTGIKERNDLLRERCLAIFTEATVESTLPAGFWNDKSNESLQQFSKEPGSMARLNFLGDIGCEEDDDVTHGCLFGGDIVRGGHSAAPKEKRGRGTWEETLNNVGKLLTCAYRAGRAANLLEAYMPFSPGECKVLNDHHSLWSTNLAYGLETLSVTDKRSIGVGDDSELGGDKAHALRFVLHRCKTFVQNVPPVAVTACGIRDSETFGKKGLHSLDTSAFTPSRIGIKLLKHVLGIDKSVGVVEVVLKHCDEFFENARNLREHTAAATNGGIGDGVKVRKSRVLLVEDSPKKREETMDIFMEALARNAFARPLEAVELFDPGFMDFALGRLAEAQQDSTTYKRVINGEDHLLGDTTDKVAEGKERVAGVLRALDEAGITPKDVATCSVATTLAIEFNGATLRPQDSLHLVGNAIKNIPAVNRMVIRIPKDGKQSRFAVRSLSTVCMEHKVGGADAVQWMAFMSLVGRPFLKQANGGRLDTVFGPLGTNGKRISEGVFKTILRGLGRAFFGLNNVSLNAIRTSQDTLAVEHVMELGLAPTALCIQELAREQKTSPKNIVDIYNLRIFDVVTVTTVWKGIVSFKDGIVGMLCRRKLRQNHQVVASSMPAGDLGAKEKELAQRLRIAEMAHKIKGFEEAKTCTCAAGAVVAVPPPGAAAGAAPVTGATSAATGAAAGAAPAAAGTATAVPGVRGSYKPKAPRETTQPEREGVQAVARAVGESFQRAKARGSKDELYHYMKLPMNKASKCYMVRHLVKHDPLFTPGGWYVESVYPAQKGTKAFDKLVVLVQDQVDDFEWSSWRNV